MKLPLMHKDKANHFIYGFVIFILSQLVFNDFISLIIVIFVSLLKEIKDEFDYNGFDIVDIIYTIIPGFLIYFLR